ncbi:MAG: iron chelate uptake ABC transporter family permease subunit, partial [Neofamilia sp.]
ISFGAAFLLIIDTVSRSIGVTELPVSILMAVIGAPVFIFLLRKAGDSF